MPRLEKDGRFFEVTREGRGLRIRSGSILGDEPVHEQQRVSHWELGAKRLLANVIESKLAEGWVIVEPSADPSALPRSPELEQALIEAPTPDRWAVYGDWLAAQGDARGELITLELELERLGPGAPRKASPLQARRDQLVGEAIARWFPEFAELSALELPRAEPGTGGGPPTPESLLRWSMRHGFLHELELGGGPGPLDIDEHPAALRDLAPLLARVLAHPSALMLERLRIGQLDREGRRDLRRALVTLAGEPRPRLRRLELTGHEKPLRKFRESGGSVRLSGIRLGSLAPLHELERWAPRLESLLLRGREIADLPDLAPLRRFELHVFDLDRALLRGLLAQTWSRIEHLTIASDVVHDPWRSYEPEFAELLTRAGAAGRLRLLGVHGSSALETLLAHPLLYTLELLILPRLCDSTAKLLIARADRLAAVRAIMVDRSLLDRQLPELRQRFGSRLVMLDEP